MNKYICCFITLLSSLLEASAKEIALLTPLTSSGEKIIESLEKEYNKNNSSLTKNNNSSLVSHVDVDNLENSDISYIDLNNIDAKKSNEYKEHLRDFILEEDKIAIIDQTTISTDNKEEKSKIMSKIFGVGATGEVVVVSLGDDGVLELNSFSNPNNKSSKVNLRTSVDNLTAKKIAKLVLDEKEVGQKNNPISINNDDDGVLSTPYARLIITAQQNFPIPKDVHGKNLFSDAENKKFGTQDYYNTIWEIFLGVTNTYTGHSDFAVMIGNAGLGFLSTPVYQKAWDWGTAFFNAGHTHYFGNYKETMLLGISTPTSHNATVYSYSPKNAIEGGTLSDSTSVSLQYGFSGSDPLASVRNSWTRQYSYNIDQYKMVADYSSSSEEKLSWNYALEYTTDGKKYNDPGDLTNWNYDACNYTISEGVKKLPTIATKVFLPEVTAVLLIPTSLQDTQDPNIKLNFSVSSDIIYYGFGYNEQTLCIRVLPSRYMYNFHVLKNNTILTIDTSDLIIPEG